MSNVKADGSGPVDVLFFRRDPKGYLWFYAVNIKRGQTVDEHVKLNPGTVRVEDAQTKRVLWEAPEETKH